MLTATYNQQFEKSPLILKIQVIFFVNYRLAFSRFFDFHGNLGNVKEKQGIFIFPPVH